MRISSTLSRFLRRWGAPFSIEGEPGRFFGLLSPQNSRGGGFGQELQAPLGTEISGEFLLAVSPGVPLRQGAHIRTGGERYCVLSLRDGSAAGEPVCRRALLRRCAGEGSTWEA